MRIRNTSPVQILRALGQDQSAITYDAMGNVTSTDSVLPSDAVQSTDIGAPVLTTAPVGQQQVVTAVSDAAASAVNAARSALNQATGALNPLNWVPWWVWVGGGLFVVYKFRTAFK